MDHFTHSGYELGSADGQQLSDLKSLPQFSVAVKTPASMMDVASQYEPIVG